MPVMRLDSSASAEHDDLVQDLLDEWTAPNPDAAEPIILEDFDRQGEIVHVYVAWDRWAQVEPAERSEIIMDAAEHRLSPDKLLRITAAMGVTLAEGRRMRLIK